MRFGHGSENNYTEGVTQVAPVYGVYESVPGSSDKTYTVPDGEMWKLMYANVILTTSASIGNRQLRFAVKDPNGNDVGYISAGAVQAAGTVRSYGFMQGIYRETSFVDSMIQVPIPIDLYLPAGSKIRFYDSSGIAPKSDSMVISFGVQRFKGC